MPCLSQECLSCEQGKIKISCEQGEIFGGGWLSLAQAEIRISRQPGEIRISLLVGWGFYWYVVGIFTGHIRFFSGFRWNFLLFVIHFNRMR